MRSVIGCASQSGSVEAVSRLLNAGCHTCDIDPDGCSSLHHAAKAGSSEVARLLISHGADVNTTSDDGSTSTHYAVNGNSAKLDEVVDVLIEAGENPFTRRNDGITPVQSIKTEMMLTALDRVPRQGPVHEVFTDPNLLSSAIATSDDQLVYRLLDHYPEVDGNPPNENCSPISTACHVGCSSTLFKKLLERSRALSDQSLGCSLLRETCRNGSDETHAIVSVLLEAGMDPNGLSTEGESALMLAARAGNTDTVKLLLSFGSDVRIKGEGGWNVAHYACAAGHLNILYVLRQTDVDWNAKVSAENETEALQEHHHLSPCSHAPQ